MSVLEWVERLGIDIGLGPLPIRERGVCELALADGSAVTFELARDGEAVLAHAVVASVGPGDDRLCELLLVESHPDRAPAGTWLALDPRSGEAVLCARLGPDEVARYEDVVGAVEAFVARLGELRDGLPGADLGPPPETPRPMRDDPLWLHSQFLRG